MRSSLSAAPLAIAAGAAAPPAERPSLEPWEELAATAAAVQNLLLAAHALGLASHWKSKGSHLPASKAMLGLQPVDHLIGYVLLGYPRPGAIPKTGPRRAHTEFVTWLE